MSEEWAPVPGYEDEWEVSTLGRVRHYLKPTVMKNGYGSVTFYDPSRRSSSARTVHSLVAEVFLGPRPLGQLVRHLDGDPSNNAIENLAYGTSQDNADDAVRHGTVPAGEGHYAFRLSDNDVRRIHGLWWSGSSMAEIAAKFEISTGYVGELLRGKKRRRIYLERTPSATTQARKES